MGSRTFVLAALGIGLAAAGFFTVRRGPGPTVPDFAVPSGADNPSSRSTTPIQHTPDGESLALEQAADDLRSVPDSFRNTTLLIAIRGAGFYCDEVVAASETVDGVWLASCADQLGYTIRISDVDTYDVQPTAHYFDQIAPAPVRVEE